MLLNPRIKKQLLSLVLRGILAIVIVAGFIIYFSKQIDLINASIGQKQILLKKASQQEVKLAALQKDYNDVVLSTYLLDGAFPASEDPLPFKRKLEDLARNTGNKATVKSAAEFASPSSFEGIKIIPYNIVLTGNLRSLLSFLAEIQRINNFVIVKALEISGENIERGATMNLKVEVYVR